MARVPSPPLVHECAYFTIVKLAHPGHLLVAERGQIAGAAVVLDLSRTFGARDGAGDRVEHQDPSQGQLRHGGAGRNETLENLHGLQADFIIHSEKVSPRSNASPCRLKLR